MPFVKRDACGAVMAISREPAEGFVEEAGPSVEDIQALLGLGEDGTLAGTDQDFIRVLEDVVDLLIDKGVFLFTELPESAQQKILQRQRLRRAAGDSLQLLGDD